MKTSPLPSPIGGGRERERRERRERERRERRERAKEGEAVSVHTYYYAKMYKILAIITISHST